MRRFLVAMMIIFLIVAISYVGDCRSSQPSFKYKSIADVPKEINELGKRICQEQRNVVTPGGNEANPGFSWDDKSAFDKSGELEKIVKSVKGSKTFKNGVDAIRRLSKEKQDVVLKRYATPLFPTWRMNGRISNAGTTDAGYEVELKIATALTDAVKAAL